MGTPQCPPGGLQSFPVQLNFTPKFIDYAALESDLGLSISWGTASDKPSFPQTGINSGEIYHTSIESGQINYGGFNYSLRSVQITAPTHKSWLALTTSEATPANNQEDVILTFMTTSVPGGNANKQPQYIILVNPIIRIARAINSSPFLTAFANQTGANISLQTVFPNNMMNQYARYTTCINGSAMSGASDFQNVLVIVNVQGLLVWNNLMDNIKKLYEGGEKKNIPSYNAPYPDMFSGNASVISNSGGNTGPLFSSVVQVSNGYASSLQTAPPPTIQTNTDAYKCVPFDPDKDISGGAIVLDSATGVPLTAEQKARKAEIDTYNTIQASTIPYQTIEYYSRIFIITIFSIIGGIILLYIIATLTVGTSETGTMGSKFKLLMLDLLKTPIYIIIAFICTFAGLTLGLVLRPIPPPTG